MRLVQILRRKWMVLFQIFFILFGVYITIQILIKVFGGSWSSETLLITIGVANITCTFTMMGYLASSRSDIRNLSSKFRCLATDFKRMSGQFTEHKIEFRHLSEEFREHTTEFKHLSEEVGEHTVELKRLSEEFKEQNAELKNHSSSLMRIEHALKRRR